MDTQVKSSGNGPRARQRSMKIYFCDICNESIPLKDINTNRITIEEGKIFCQRCAPKQGRATERVPGPVLAVFTFVVLLLGGVAFMGWKLLSDQSAELKSLSETVDRMQASLSGVPTTLEDTGDKLGRLGGDVHRMGADLASAKSEIRQRHDALDGRVQSAHESQKKSLGDAMRQLSISLQGDIDGLKAGLDDLKTNRVNPALVDMEVLKEKLDLLQDLVTGLTQPRMAPVEPTPEPAVVAEGPEDGGADKALEDAEINRHISKLTASDPGDRYSAVIALGHYSGVRVVKALEGMLTPDPDPEDYVRVAVIERLRELGSPSSVPHVIVALRDADYFVRVAARGALRAITGTRMKFDPDGSPSEREGQIKSWERWWAENKAKLLASTSA